MSSFYANQPVDTNKRLEKRFKEREDEYITYKQFHVLVGTFNVNNRQALSNHHLDDWLHRQIEKSEKNVETFPDIIAVGFQEIDTSGGAYVYDDKKKEDEWEQAVRKTIQSSYHSKDEKKRFQLLHRVRLMGKFDDQQRGANRCLFVQGFYSLSMFVPTICHIARRYLVLRWPLVSWG